MIRSACVDCGTVCQGQRCIRCHRAVRAAPATKHCLGCGRRVGPTSNRCRRCAGLLRRGLRAHHSGYLRSFSPEHPLSHRDGYVLEHRRVLFDAGVEIPSGWHVHHRNGDKHDNRLENLQVLSPSRHSQHHAAKAETFTNQFGTFPRVDQQTEEEREAKRRRRAAYLRAWRERRNALGDGSGADARPVRG